jgi:hypothetical protein
VLVEEVMQAPVTPEQLAGQGRAAAAAAADSTGCSQQQQQVLMAEMREVDRQWLSRKGKHAGGRLDGTLRFGANAGALPALSGLRLQRCYNL